VSTGRYAIDPEVLLEERYDIELAMTPNTKKHTMGSRYPAGILRSMRYNAPQSTIPAIVKPVT